MSESEQAVLDKSVFVPPYYQLQAEHLTEILSADVRLLDLSVAEHGEKMMEGANRLLRGHLPLPWEMKQRT